MGKSQPKGPSDADLLLRARKKQEFELSRALASSQRPLTARKRQRGRDSDIFRGGDTPNNHSNPSESVVGSEKLKVAGDESEGGVIADELELLKTELLQASDPSLSNTNNLDDSRMLYELPGADSLSNPNKPNNPSSPKKSQARVKNALEQNNPNDPNDPNNLASRKKRSHLNLLEGNPSNPSNSSNLDIAGQRVKKKLKKERQRESESERQRERDEKKQSVTHFMTAVEVLIALITLITLITLTAFIF